MAEQVELRVPTLWRYEVGNVLGLKKPKMALELMGALLAYEFDEVPLRNEYALDVLEHGWGRCRESRSMMPHIMSSRCEQREST